MRLPLAALLACAVAPALGAQGVTGVVRDSITQLPLPGAVVILTDAGGAAVARRVTDRQGVYRLPAPPAGARLRVLRLGFRPREVGLLPAGNRMPESIALVAIPLLLETVRTVAAANCPRRADREEAFSLLEQVRAGLLAAIVGRANSTATMKRIRYERRFDGNGAPIQQKVSIDLAMVDRPYSAARNAAGFVRLGFMEDTSSLYFAPEAETLVDPAFAAGYCFHIMPPEPSRPGQVGLGFRAARRRGGRVDIDGVLWVDSTARALTDLEYRYAGLPRMLTEFAPGGRLSFTEMPNGVPLITSWSIRLASAHRGAPPGTRAIRDASGRLMRIEIDDTGGQLAEAVWPDGTSWRAPLGTVRIRARSSSGQPAAQRVVRLLDSGYEARTDSAGIAELRQVLPGTYTAAVVDSQLAVVGIVLAAPAPVRVTADSLATAELAAWSAEEYVGRSCAGAGLPGGTSSILGRVVMPDGKSATGAAWTIHSAGGELLADGGTVGSDGLLQWCEAWPGETVRVTARLRDWSTSVTQQLGAGLTVFQLVLGRGGD